MDVLLLLLLLTGRDKFAAPCKDKTFFSLPGFMAASIAAICCVVASVQREAGENQ